MRCRQVDRLIEPYLEGRLPALKATRLEEHLDRCPACRARVAEAQRVQQVLAEEARPQAPQGFAVRVMSQVYAEESRHRPARARQERVPVYRRLGYSFMASAAVLSVSLFIPRLAYPSIIGTEAVATELGRSRSSSVVQMLDEAGRGVGRVFDLQTKGTR